MKRIRKELDEHGVQTINSVAARVDRNRRLDVYLNGVFNGISPKVELRMKGTVILTSTSRQESVEQVSLSCFSGLISARGCAVSYARLLARLKCPKSSVLFSVQ